MTFEKIKCYSCPDLNPNEYPEQVSVIHTNIEQIKICRDHRHRFDIIPHQKESSTLRQKENDKPIKTKTKGYIVSQYVESVLVNDKPKFLCKQENGNFLIQNNIENEDEIIRPLDAEEYGYHPYSFSSEEDIQKLYHNKISTNEILEEIKQMVDHFIVAKHESKTLLQGDYLLSYCLEWISTVHYTFSVGETESGKSSILHLARWLCYRCLYGEDIPIADIFSFLGQEEEGAGTIAEDEAQDIWNNKEKMNMYKNSYSKGSKKSRIVGVDSIKRKQVHFKTFGPKWFAGERIPSNKGFNERLAIIYMVEGEPEGNIKRPTKDEVHQLHHLRNKMLIWKLQNIGKEDPIINSGLKGRDQELWEDFLSLGNDTEFQEDFQQVVKHYTKQRHDKIRNSIEAKLFQLICNKLDKDCTVKFTDIWEILVSGNSGILGRINETTAIFYPDEYYDKVSKQFLSKLIESKFQGIKHRNKLRDAEKRQHQITVYQFKKDVMQRLAKKYDTELTIDHPLNLGEHGEHGEHGEQSNTKVTKVTTLEEEVQTSQNRHEISSNEASDNIEEAKDGN